MSKNSNLNILYMCGDRGLDLTITEGYRIHVIKILENLANLDQNVFLLTVNDKQSLPGFNNYHCVRHRYIPLIHHIVPYTGTLDSLSIAMSIIRFNRVMKFDVIHERFGLYSWGGLLASRLLGIPLVLEINGPCIEEKGMFSQPMQGWQRKTAVYFRKLCLNNADTIIAVSNVLKEFLINNCGIHENRFIVMPNAADVPAFSANRPGTLLLRGKYDLEGSFIIGFVGTLQVWYGLDTLINAMPYILKEVPNAKLLFVGDGQAREHLKNRANEIGLADKVLFIGSKPHEEIPGILKTLDVAAATYVDLPTKFFGSAIKLFEYLAAGKAIVASKIGQIPEIIDHKRNGLLVEQGNPQQIAEAIIQIATKPHLKRNLEIAAAITGKQYSWENYAKKLITIYENLIKINKRIR